MKKEDDSNLNSNPNKKHKSISIKANASDEKINEMKQDLLRLKNSKMHSQNQDITNPNEELLNLIYENIISEMDYLIENWENKLIHKQNSLNSPPELPELRSSQNPDHLEIMGLFYKTEKELKKYDDELEIYINDLKDNTDDEKILPLFDLLDKELTSDKKKVNIRDTFSDTKTLDRSELLKEFKKYQDEIIDSKKTKKSSSTTKNKKKSKSKSPKIDRQKTEELILLEKPSFIRVFIGFFIDLSLVLSGSLAYLYQNNRELIGAFISLKNGFQHELIIQVLTPVLPVFFIIWFSYSLFATILYDTTIGLKVSGISVCNKDGSSPSFSAMFKRILMHIINFITLGARPLLMALKRNGFYCKVSKTQLAYTNSIPIDKEEYLI